MIHTISWDAFQRDAEVLCQRLEAAPRPQGLLAVARGGLIPAALIAQTLGLRQIETACLKSYEGQERKAVMMLHAPVLANDGEGWLIIDDLVDSGETVRALREHYPRARVAVVYAKPAGAALADYFARSIAQETWLSFPWERVVGAA